MIEPGKREHKVFIGLKLRSEVLVEFKFFNKLSEKQENLNPSQVEAKCVAIPERASHLSKLTESDREQEFEILWNAQTQSWTAYMTNGKFLLNLVSRGYLEHT